MNWTAEAMPSSAIPEAMDWMTRTPRRADQVLPRPPNRLVPPMTAAAIAFIRRLPAPEDWFAALIWEARNMPPTAAIVPAREKTEIRTNATLMPARRAASTLPPKAKICRPYRVRRSTKSRATTTPRKITTASGRPLYWFSSHATR